MRPQSAALHAVLGQRAAIYLGAMRTLCFLAIASCKVGDPIPVAAEVPYPAQHHYESHDRKPGHPELIDITMSSFATIDLNATLYIARGNRSGEGYHASELVLGTEQRVGCSKQARIAERCGGTADYADYRWTIALTGSSNCTAWNGTYEATSRPHTEPAAAETARSSATGPCAAYRDCVCELSAMWMRRSTADNPFDATCHDAEALLAAGKDDPETCATSRTAMAKSAVELWPKIKLPAVCR